MAASNIKKERNIPQLIEHFKIHLQQSTMLQSAFAHVDFSKLTLASIFYSLNMERGYAHLVGKDVCIDITNQ